LEAARRQTLTESAAAQGGTRVLFYEKNTELGFWGILGLILPFGSALRHTRWGSPLKKRHKRKTGLTNLGVVWIYSFPSENEDETKIN